MSYRELDRVQLAPAPRQASDNDSLHNSDSEEESDLTEVDENDPETEYTVDAIKYATCKDTRAYDVETHEFLGGRVGWLYGVMWKGYLKTGSDTEEPLESFGEDPNDVRTFWEAVGRRIPAGRDEPPPGRLGETIETPKALLKRWIRDCRPRRDYETYKRRRAKEKAGQIITKADSDYYWNKKRRKEKARKAAEEARKAAEDARAGKSKKRQRTGKEEATKLKKKSRETTREADDISSSSRSMLPPPVKASSPATVPKGQFKRTASQVSEASHVSQASQASFNSLFDEPSPSQPEAGPGPSTQAAQALAAKTSTKSSSKAGGKRRRIDSSPDPLPISKATRDEEREARNAVIHQLKIPKRTTSNDSSPVPAAQPAAQKSTAASPPPPSGTVATTSLTPLQAPDPQPPSSPPIPLKSMLKSKTKDGRDRTPTPPSDMELESEPESVPFKLPDFVPFQTQRASPDPAEQTQSLFGRPDPDIFTSTPTIDAPVPAAIPAKQKEPLFDFGPQSQSEAPMNIDIQPLGDIKPLATPSSSTSPTAEAAASTQPLPPQSMDGDGAQPAPVNGESLTAAPEQAKGDSDVEMTSLEPGEIPSATPTRPDASPSKGGLSALALVITTATPLKDGAQDPTGVPSQRSPIKFKLPASPPKSPPKPSVLFTTPKAAEGPTQDASAAQSSSADTALRQNESADAAGTPANRATSTGSPTQAPHHPDPRIRRKLAAGGNPPAVSTPTAPSRESVAGTAQPSTDAAAASNGSHTATAVAPPVPAESTTAPAEPAKPDKVPPSLRGKYVQPKRIATLDIQVDPEAELRRKQHESGHIGTRGRGGRPRGASFSRSPVTAIVGSLPKVSPTTGPHPLPPNPTLAAHPQPGGKIPAYVPRQQHPPQQNAPPQHVPPTAVQRDQPQPVVAGRAPGPLPPQQAVFGRKQPPWPHGHATSGVAGYGGVSPAQGHGGVSPVMGGMSPAMGGQSPVVGNGGVSPYGHQSPYAGNLSPVQGNRSPMKGNGAMSPNAAQHGPLATIPETYRDVKRDPRLRRQSVQVGPSGAAATAVQTRAPKGTTDASHTTAQMTSPPLGMVPGLVYDRKARHLSADMTLRGGGTRNGDGFALLRLLAKQPEGSKVRFDEYDGACLDFVLQQGATVLEWAQVEVAERHRSNWDVYYQRMTALGTILVCVDEVPPPKGPITSHNLVLVVLPANAPLEEAGLNGWDKARIGLAIIVLAVPFDWEQSPMLPNPVRPDFVTGEVVQYPRSGRRSPNTLSQSYGFDGRVTDNPRGSTIIVSNPYSQGRSPLLYDRICVASKEAGMERTPDGVSPKSLVMFNGFMDRNVLSTTAQRCLDRLTRFFTIGPDLRLPPPCWQMQEVWKTGGLVTFSPTLILSKPDRFLDIVELIRRTPDWDAYVVPHTINWCDESWRIPARCRDAAAAYGALTSALHLDDPQRQLAGKAPIDGGLAVTLVPPQLQERDLCVKWLNWLRKVFACTEFNSLVDLCREARQSFTPDGRPVPLQSPTTDAEPELHLKDIEEFGIRDLIAMRMRPHILPYRRYLYVGPLTIPERDRAFAAPIELVHADDFEAILGGAV